MTMHRVGGWSWAYKAGNFAVACGRSRKNLSQAEAFEEARQLAVDVIDNQPEAVRVWPEQRQLS